MRDRLLLGREETPAAAAAPLAGLHILDVGCGAGIVSEQLGEKMALISDE